MSLIECQALWGEAHIMYGMPPVKVYNDVTFIPYCSDGPWGLFDSTRKAISEAFDYRGPNSTPHQTFQEHAVEVEHASDGAFLYCGWLNPHYGHFIINSLPRFWPFFQSAPACAEKVLLASPASEMPAFAKSVLEGLGIKNEMITSFTKPTRIRQITMPMPALQEQYWIYTIYRDLCKKIGEPFWCEPDKLSRPAYLSKSQLKLGVGKFEEELLIENIMKEAGVDVIYPETLSWREQVKMFSQRRLLVGSTGSAFHTSLFAPDNRNILCYSASKEYNSNFALVDKICNNNSEYFYQEGMIYSGSKNFLTVVTSENPQQLGKDLVERMRERHAW